MSRHERAIEARLGAGGEREREEEEEEEEEEEFVRIHRARCQTDSASLYTLAVRRRELRFKNHHPDPRTSRYGQRLVEEILGCRMSGWLTPKLECNKKLQAIPPPRDSEGT